MFRRENLSGHSIINAFLQTSTSQAQAAKPPGSIWCQSWLNAVHVVGQLSSCSTTTCKSSKNLETQFSSFSPNLHQKAYLCLLTLMRRTNAPHSMWHDARLALREARQHFTCEVCSILLSFRQASCIRTSQGSPIPLNQHMCPLPGKSEPTKLANSKEDVCS